MDHPESFVVPGPKQRDELLVGAETKKGRRKM
jgi:hypothetical protein